MITYIEGVDGSGKSTLCDKLKELGYEVIKTQEVTLSDYSDILIKSKYKNLVLDRGPLTDLVYRLNDTNDLMFTLYEIQNLLKDSQIIYCNTDTSYKDSIERGEFNIIDENVHERIKSTYKWMLKLMRRYCNCDVYYYNWKINSIDEVVNFIGGKHGV